MSRKIPRRGERLLRGLSARFLVFCIGRMAFLAFCQDFGAISRLSQVYAEKCARMQGLFRLPYGADAETVLFEPPQKRVGLLRVDLARNDERNARRIHPRVCACDLSDGERKVGKASCFRDRARARRKRFNDGGVRRVRNGFRAFAVDAVERRAERVEGCVGVADARHAEHVIGVRHFGFDRVFAPQGLCECRSVSRGTA